MPEILLGFLFKQRILYRKNAQPATQFRTPKREWPTILHIVQRNGFPPTVIQKLRHQIKHKTKHTTVHKRTNKNKRWATFTYICPQIRKVTNIFKNTNVRIVFRCRINIAKIIRPPKHHDIPPHNKWGIYQIKCNTCDRSYVGQTSLVWTYVSKNTLDTSGTIIPNQHMVNSFNKTSMITDRWIV